MESHQCNGRAKPTRVELFSVIVADRAALSDAKLLSCLSVKPTTSISAPSSVMGRPALRPASLGHRMAFLSSLADDLTACAARNAKDKHVHAFPPDRRAAAPFPCIKHLFPAAQRYGSVHRDETQQHHFCLGVTVFMALLRLLCACRLRRFPLDPAGSDQLVA